MKNTKTAELTVNKGEVIYCSDCGMELDNFALYEMVNDYNLLIKKFASCKKDGKFSGDLCSKIFKTFKGTADSIPKEKDNEFF